MQWTKNADVTPGVPNKAIKPGTTDSGIGKDYREEEKFTVMDEPKGDQKEPKETTRPDEAVGEGYKRTDNQDKTDAPEGKQKDVPQKTHTEKPAKDVMSEGKTMSASKPSAWMKKAESTPGEANKDIKPGTTDKSIGYDFKENDGESEKVLDEPSGDQKAIPQKTQKDEKIGEEYKEEGNQEKTKAPEGDQKPIKSETHESDVSGESYKEDGKNITEKDASLTKVNAWLKNPVSDDAEPTLPERFASFTDMADEYATLYGFYCHATNEQVDPEVFGKAVAHIGLQSSNTMIERIDKMLTTIARTLDRVKPRDASGWKEAIGGYMKREGGMYIIAKTREEAASIDKCVEAKIAEAGFKPSKGRTKRESAFAACINCAPAPVVAPEKKEEVKADAVKPTHSSLIIDSMAKRAEKDAKFAAVYSAIDKKDFDGLVERLSKLEDKGVDIVKLAHYRFDCQGCFDAIIGNIEKGLVPTDFTKK